jgi:hypothetical protein
MVPFLTAVLLNNVLPGSTVVFAPVPAGLHGAHVPLILKLPASLQMT